MLKHAGSAGEGSVPEPGDCDNDKFRNAVVALYDSVGFQGGSIPDFVKFITKYFQAAPGNFAKFME